MLVVVVALVLAEELALVLVSDEVADPELPHPKSASVAAQATATAREVIRFVLMVPQSSDVPCRAGGGCWN